MKKTKKSVENCCEIESCCTEKKHCKCGCHKGGNSCAIYGLGVIGSLFYFLSGVSGFSAVMVGIAKSIFWPAFVVFKILGLLQI